MSTIGNARHRVFRCAFPGCRKEVRGAFTGAGTKNHDRLHFCSKHYNSKRERKIIERIRHEQEGART